MEWPVGAQQAPKLRPALFGPPFPALARCADCQFGEILHTAVADRCRAESTSPR